MTMRGWTRLGVITALAIWIATTTPAEGRGGGRGGGGGFSGGGGGARGGGYGGYGGGYSGGAGRSSFSGNGSIRYSAPSAPSYSRPAPRPSTPVAAQRPANMPSRGGFAPGSAAPSFTPPGYGSVSRGGIGAINGGTATTPGGSTIGGIRGPGGGGAVGIRGPGGGAAGAIRGPGGGGAAGIQGPGGVRGGGAVWGPNGGVVAGARGPYGGFVAARLPAGAVHHPWGGSDYWHAGYAWYSPCWIGDDVHYAWAYPPVGYYYPELPPEYTTIEIDESTYYYSEGVYYQKGEKDGQEGYVVAEAPEGSNSEKSRDPFQILKGMCDYLGGSEKINVTVNTTADSILASGEKVQTSARRTVCISRPDKIAAYVSGDNGEKRLIYDGKTVSLYDRKQGVYTVIQVPDTIDAALDSLANDYGIVMPLDDLVCRDSFARLTAHAKAGQYLGKSKFAGTDCHHLAFTTEAVDWEVWIDAGDKPLPRRITIDYKQHAGNPRYSGVLAWEDASRFTPRMFEFTPPSGVQRIQMAPTRATATAPATNPATSANAGKEMP